MLLDVDCYSFDDKRRAEGIKAIANMQYHVIAYIPCSITQYKIEFSPKVFN